MSETSETVSLDVPMSEPLVAHAIPEESEEGSVIAEAPTPNKVRFRSLEEGHRPLMADLHNPVHENSSPLRNATLTEPLPAGRISAAATDGFRLSKERLAALESQSATSESSSVILEQAWIMKMAGEIAKRVYDEKHRQQGNWDEREEAPPPAYEAATR